MQDEMTHFPSGGDVQNQETFSTGGCIRGTRCRHIETDEFLNRQGKASTNKVSRCCSFWSVQKCALESQIELGCRLFMVGVRPASL